MSTVCVSREATNTPFPDYSRIRWSDGVSRGAFPLTFIRLGDTGFEPVTSSVLNAETVLFCSGL